jgi:hypothetical protein
MHLFMALRNDPAFLGVQPSTWCESPEYVHAKQKVTGLKVINGCTERAVKLATDINSAFTYDETKRQLVFQIVEYYRKQITEPLKKCYSTTKETSTLVQLFDPVCHRDVV